MAKCFLLLSIFLCALHWSISKEARVVCYYGSWATYRPGDGKFDIKNVDPTLCTHLIYSFATVAPDGSVKLRDPDRDIEGLKQMNDLKNTNPDLKIMVAVGGYTDGPATFSKAAASPEGREIFAKSVVEMMEKHNLDGFDLDWEYPAEGERGGKPEDKKNAVLLLKAIRDKFEQSSKKYLLSAAVGATESRISTSYDLPAFVEPLDFVNLMTYDFHGVWEPKTGHNAPLENDPGLNDRDSLQSYLSKGVPSSKIVLGVPFYGNSYTLLGQGNDVGSPAQKGMAGPFTREGGKLGYNEICVMQATQQGWTEKWDENQKVPYMFKDKDWVGFDNVKSIELKADLAKSKQLGGVMVWSIETDDFLGKCGTKYPLLKAINKSLKGLEVPDEPARPAAPAATASTTVEEAPPGGTTAAGGGGGDDCTADGYIRDSKDCGTFYNCQNVNGAFVKSEFHCPADLVFNLNANTCDWPANVPDCA